MKKIACRSVLFFKKIKASTLKIIIEEIFFNFLRVTNLLQLNEILKMKSKNQNCTFSH